MERIGANSVLPARRDPVTLTTADGLRLVGELALPLADPVATLVTVHPLPTHGGMMDSHIYRKAAWRLPALADIAVLRFNTRGTSSAAGTSQGQFDASTAEGLDVQAAVEFVAQMANIWLVGWSFGTDVVLRHGLLPAVRGAILLSPPLRYATDADIDRWGRDGRPLVVMVPEEDDYLPPLAARPHFARAPQAQFIPVQAAKHLWVGERAASTVLNQIVTTVTGEVTVLPNRVGRANGEVERPMSQLSGKKAIVTGASRGIGRAIAVEYARQGADVALLARNEEMLTEVAQEIEGLGRTAVVTVADVLDPAAVHAAAASAIHELGGLDIVVNNAGGNSFSSPVVGMRFSGWEKTQKLNVDSTVHMLQAVGPTLLEQKSGSVINVASVAGMRGAPMMSHYGAAKAAIMSLTRSVAVEWAWAGVRVNTLLPGWIETDLTEFLRAAPDNGAGVLARVPMQRWGQVPEIAAGAVFLACDASSFMTGQELILDGGLSAMP